MLKYAQSCNAAFASRVLICAVKTAFARLAADGKWNRIVATIVEVLKCWPKKNYCAHALVHTTGLEQATNLVNMKRQLVSSAPVAYVLVFAFFNLKNCIRAYAVAVLID